MNKAAGILFWLTLVCAACFGQTSFQGLTPGTSTRGDVARALGQPIRTVSATVLEYSAPAGIAKVEVVYRAGSSLVDLIRVYFLKPISRSALIQKLKLPPQADTQTKNAEGKLVEYFGGSSLLALVYAEADASSGVSRIGYHSRESFQSAVARVSGARQNPGTGSSSNNSGSATGPADPEQPGNTRPPAEPSAGGTPYQGLMPGKSTRADVDRLLGQPIKEHNQTLLEYRSNTENQSNIFVQYRKDSTIIECIEILLAQPLARSYVRGVKHLPEQPITTRVNGKGNLEEYFGPPFYIALTYQGANMSIGVVRTERYSRELFLSASLENSSGTTGAAGNDSISVRRSDPPGSARHGSCFTAEPSAGVTVRSNHYDWAKQQDSGQLDGNLRYKLGLLFQCPALGDDQLATAFASISVLISTYVPNAKCFDGNRGVISADFSAHRDWARARSRQDVLNNLQSKVSAALRCLDRNGQLDFFAEVSVIIAKSGT